MIVTSTQPPPISLIYYVSPRFVQQVSSALLGKTPVETTSSKTERQSLSRKLRGALATTLGILSMRTEGERETSQGTEQLNAMKYTTTDDDRAIAVFQQMLRSGVPSVESIDGNQQPQDIYWVQGPAKVRHRRVQESAAPVVEVECRTPLVTVVGVTSPDNWVAPSLLSELIYLSAATTSALPVTALFAPLSVESREGIVRVLAKYIAIGGASVFIP